MDGMESFVWETQKESRSVSFRNNTMLVRRAMNPSAGTRVCTKRGLPHIFSSEQRSENKKESSVNTAEWHARFLHRNVGHLHFQQRHAGAASSFGAGRRTLGAARSSAAGARTTAGHRDGGGHGRSALRLDVAAGRADGSVAGKAAGGAHSTSPWRSGELSPEALHGSSSSGSADDLLFLFVIEQAKDIEIVVGSMERSFQISWFLEGRSDADGRWSHGVTF